MSLRAYSNRFLMLHNHRGMMIPRAFHSCWRLFALDQIQLDAYCSMVNRRFSILCSDHDFPFCVVNSVVFLRFYLFSCVTAPNYSRQALYIILQKNVICWSMGPLRWVVSKKESSWSMFVYVAIWLPLGHCSWLARKVTRTLSLSNEFLNTVGVFLIHKPIIRFTFSGSCDIYV